MPHRYFTRCLTALCDCGCGCGCGLCPLFMCCRDAQASHAAEVSALTSKAATCEGAADARSAQLEDLQGALQLEKDARESLKNDLEATLRTVATLEREHFALQEALKKQELASGELEQALL